MPKLIDLLISTQKEIEELSGQKISIDDLLNKEFYITTTYQKSKLCRVVGQELKTGRLICNGCKCNCEADSESCDCMENDLIITTGLVMENSDA